MALTTKPTIKNVWATSGLKVEPSEGKMDTGWIVERPPHQFQNWLQNRVDQFIKHVNEAGIPAWDAVTVYTGGKSYVQGSDGFVYKALTDGFNQNPVGNTTNWAMTFGDIDVRDYAETAEDAALSASGSASEAAESAGNADISEAAAAASAAAALTSANNSATSAAAALASQNAAATSATNAATSATNAENAYIGSQDIWADLQDLLATGPVISVNGYTGEVTLTKTDLGLGNVSNLAPADLPISTATATALAGKQASLGYTPVRQGGGIGQDANTPVYVGYNTSTSKLKVTINNGATFDLGNVAFDADLATKANIASPTFTSSATVQSTTFPTITLNKTDTSSSNQIVGKNNGTTRWVMVLGNSAQDFTINTYNSSGAYVSTPFAINSVGNLFSSGVWSHTGGFNVTGASTLNGFVNSNSKITTSSPGNAFESTGYSVSGSINFNNFMSVNPTYGFVMSAQHQPGNFALIEYQMGGTAVFRFSSVGSGTALSGWTTFSDARLKTEKEVITDALDKVDELTGYTYIRTDASKEFGANLKRHAGLLAQDVQAVLPEVVEEDQDGYLTLSYDGVVPLLVNAIKELRAEVLALKQQLNA